MRCIDLNCDLGEGAPHDAALMPWITSANIACGGHAGDEATMRATLRLARRHGVAVGAHPGFADREHFGRRELPLTPAAAAALVREQVARLRAEAQTEGLRLSHVKLHGALYHLAAREAGLAAAVVAAVRGMAERPALFVPAGSTLERIARACAGLPVAAEVFADRSYEPDGSLTPRTVPDAVAPNAAAAARQAVRLAQEGRVTARGGAEVRLRAETICLHGDGAHPVELARRIRAELAAAGVTVRAFAPLEADAAP